MNERIQEMWAEATGSVWPRPHKFTAGEYDIHLEKFAELIIQDCCKVLENWRQEPFPFDEDLAVSLIKEQFGLK